MQATDERFLAVQVGIARHIGQQGGGQHVALACAAHQRLGAAGDGGIDPAVDALRRRLVDHRADEGGLVARVAGASPATAAASRSHSASKTARWAMIRCTLMQLCPLW